MATEADLMRNRTTGGPVDQRYVSSVQPLNPRMERFVAEFLVDLCGKKAAERAGYSPATAKSQASRLLGKPAIRPGADGCRPPAAP
jgi:terminase small subunit-like protein